MIPMPPPGTPPLSEAQRLENQRNIMQFRNVFAGENGMMVWAFLHRQLGTFDTLDNPTDAAVALQRFGWKMYEWAGVNYEINLHEMANALLNVTPVFETVKLIEKERGS